MNNEGFFTNLEGESGEKVDQKSPESLEFDETIEKMEEGFNFGEHQVMVLEMVGYEASLLEGNQGEPAFEALGRMAANAEDWKTLRISPDSFFGRMANDDSRTACEKMTESVRAFVEYEEKKAA